MAESQPSGVRLVFRTEATPSNSTCCRPRTCTPACRPGRTASTTCSSTAGWPSRPACPAAPRHDRHVHRAPVTKRRPGRHAALRRAGRRRKGRRDLAAAQRDHRARRAAHRRTHRARRRRDAQGVAAPRQLDQPRLRRRRARPRSGPRWRRRSAAWTLINLGLGGSALLDPFTARAMRDTPADLISLKIGINLVNTDLMRPRAFTPAVHGFLDTHPRRTPGHAAAGRLADPLPHPRGHARPRRLRPRRARPTGKMPVRGHGRPGGARRRQADAHRHPRRAAAHRRSSARPKTRTCTTSTGSTSTDRRTSTSCRCPTGCIRTGLRTAASASASPAWPSGPEARQRRTGPVRPRRVLTI